MKKLSLIFSSLLVAAAVVVGVSGKVSAQVVADPKCESEVYARSYSVGADTVTSNFEVKKVQDGLGPCTKDVTVAAWNAPNGTTGAPFDQQTFVDSKSGSFAPGFHSLTVKKPTCFYQVDLLRGLSPFGANGGGVNYADWQYVSSAHGGEECKPVPPPTPAPTPPAPAPVQPAAQPQVVSSGKGLPNTGPADILGISAATGAAAGIVHNIRRRIIRK